MTGKHENSERENKNTCSGGNSIMWIYLFNVIVHELWSDIQTSQQRLQLYIFRYCIRNKNTLLLYFNVFRTPFVPNSSIYGSCATYRAQDITLLQLNMSMPRFISRSPAYIGSSHGEEIALIDLSSLTSCPITSMVTVPAEELVLLIQL